ncbi:MAG: Gfo/Idh/MocA family protein [Planctomycetota bacterium]|jgi:predicted dehydrogenase
MSELSRRKFLKTTAAGIAVPSVILAGAKRGLAAPSERVRIAVIGVGGQGSGHAEDWAEMDQAELVAVCDVDPKHRNKVAKETNSKPVEDYRRIMDDKSIDAVSIATPDHWHTPVALAALVAGKHVYVEKPCCHNIYEGKLLVKAAKEFGKCVQHGTQYRGNDDAIEGIRQMREEGIIGEMHMAKAINHQRRGKIGRKPVESPPPGVNYDLWLGPAPVHGFTKNRWHYDWHWFWDYGTGDMGNDGIHQVDVARWGVGQMYPKASLVSGGQLWYDDDHQTPDTQTIVFEYDGCHLIFEMRLWTPYNLGACHICKKHKGHDNGVIFYGTKGKMEIGRKGCHVIIDGDSKKIKGKGGDGIKENFIKCIKANDPSKLLAPIDEGFASAVLCHIGNIGVRLGGARLEYDGNNHRFINNDKANKYIKGHYRKGYELAYTG